MNRVWTPRIVSATYDHATATCTGHNSSGMPAVAGITETDIRNLLKAGQDTTKYPSF
jgi:hypothetical protein